MHQVFDAKQFLAKAAGGMQRIQEIMKERPQVGDATDAVPLPRFSKAIALNHFVRGAVSGERLALPTASPPPAPPSGSNRRLYA